MRKRDIIDCRDMAMKFVEMANSILEDDGLKARDFGHWARDPRMYNLKAMAKVLSNYLLDLRRSNDDYILKYPERRNNVYPD